MKKLIKQIKLPNLLDIRFSMKTITLIYTVHMYNKSSIYSLCKIVYETLNLILNTGWIQ